MKSQEWLWQIINEDGTALTGYKTEEEAKADLPRMKEGKTWRVSLYKKENWE